MDAPILNPGTIKDIEISAVLVLIVVSAAYCLTYTFKWIKLRKKCGIIFLSIILLVSIIITCLFLAFLFLGIYNSEYYYVLEFVAAISGGYLLIINLIGLFLEIFIKEDGDNIPLNKN